MPSIKSLPEFDAAPTLDSEAAVAAYLTDILEANDPALLAAILGDIARARGMSEIAKASGLIREALYKALRPHARQRIRTQRLVQGFAGKPGRLGNFTHAARTGEVAQGRRQQRRIVRFQNVSDTRRLPLRCRDMAPCELKAGI